METKHNHRMVQVSLIVLFLIALFCPGVNAWWWQKKSPTEFTLRRGETIWIWKGGTFGSWSYIFSYEGNYHVRALYKMWFWGLWIVRKDQPIPVYEGMIFKMFERYWEVISVSPESIHIKRCFDVSRIASVA